MAEKILFPESPVLLVDDEIQFLQSASFSLKSAGINNIITCNDSREVMKILETTTPALILLDIMMPYVTGKELLPLICGKFPGLHIIIMTAINEVETAVECMKSGACDYLVKPVDKARLVSSVRKAVEMAELLKENSRLKDSLLSAKLAVPEAFESIITRNMTMLSIFRYIEAVAKSPMPVLVTGETGTGKELFAHAVHIASGRKGEYVALNVAGLDDELCADTLFGHKKGAFTGAQADRAGMVAKAAGGTLFLDEIGDLSKESQIKLLRLIENKQYYPVGADSPVYTDTRIVVATNKPIDVMMKEGSFRQDLYYRLQSHIITIPPLRERKDNLPLLLSLFSEEAAKAMAKEVPSYPRELLILLANHFFPGNIRELKSMVYDAVSRHTGGIMSLDAFRDKITAAKTAPAVGKAGEAQNGSSKMMLFDELPTLEEAEETLIAEALKRAQNNQTIAANMLGLSRTALNKRLHRS